MQLPLQITVRDMEHSPALDEAIRDKAAKLEHYYSKITACRVGVEMAQKHKHQGKLFNVRIDITVPGHEFVINRELNEDVYVALRDAFDAAKRQLEEHGRKQRGEVKHHARAETATPDEE